VPELNFFHVHASSMGYGRFGVSLAQAMRDLGIDVYDDMPIPDEERRPHEENSGSVSKRCNVVVWASVPGHARGWWDGQYRGLYTMWESQKLPETFRESLHSFDVIVVPSRQNQELFSRYHDNVQFNPLGVDPKQWHPEERPSLTDEFRFLVAGSGPRKGTDLAYKAFMTLWGKEGSWGSGPVPYLVMKNPRREEFPGSRVHVIGGKIPAEQEIDLYALAHCFVVPSRGEGYGLQPLQALAQGCPTILTAAHGHDAFAHLGLGISATSSKASYFVYGDAGDWWEPDFDELCDRMRWVYDHYDQACSQALRSAVTVAEEFTWARTAQRFVDIVTPERLGVPYSGPGTWATPVRRSFPVVVTRNWSCDVAGTRYKFRKGIRYWESADLKRILFEAGFLDPICLEGDDVGLAPEQLAEIPDYTAARSWCESCGQRLNTRPTRADDIEEALNAHAGQRPG
jgi:glycosyltransferase involved in cell wall biosynthesis